MASETDDSHTLEIGLGLAALSVMAATFFPFAIAASLCVISIATLVGSIYLESKRDAQCRGICSPPDEPPDMVSEGEETVMTKRWVEIARTPPDSPSRRR